MSKIESGKATLNIQPFRMAEQIAQVDSVIRQQAVLRDQQFTVQVHDLLHENVEGDATRLRQVLLNILSNAVKYTGHGGSISLNVEEILRSGHYARYKFTVTDNGIGMSEAFQKHIYESFSRAENSVTNKVQGTGLGMAITKNIVDMMGGVITLQSQLGKGTRFEVVLDFKICEETVQAAPAVCPAPAQDSPSLHGMRSSAPRTTRSTPRSCSPCWRCRALPAPSAATVPRSWRNSDRGPRRVRRHPDGRADARHGRLRSHPDDPQRCKPAGPDHSHHCHDSQRFCRGRQKSLDVGMNAHLSKPVDLNALEQTLQRFRYEPSAEQLAITDSIKPCR